MRKIIVFVTIILNLSAITFEQNFNIVSIKVKKIIDVKSKSYYAKSVIDESKVYDISIRYSGFIQNIYADKLYYKVKKGDTLFDIYSKEIYDLSHELVASKGVSKTLVSTVSERLRLYEVDEKSIQDITNGKVSSNVSYKSPYSGYVITKKINQGSFVKSGKLLFQIASYDSLWIIAKVYQRDREFVKLGMSANIEFEGITKSFDAKIEAIYPTINKKDLTFDVRLSVDNAKGDLFDGMFAKVKLLQNQKEFLSIPKEAVIKRDGSTYVFQKVSDSEYEPLEVKLVYRGSNYEIIEGLEEGDVIVKNALFLLDADAVTNGLYDSDW